MVTNEPEDTAPGRAGRLPFDIETGRGAPVVASGGAMGAMDESPPALSPGSRFPFSALALVVVLTGVLAWVAFRQFDREAADDPNGASEAGSLAFNDGSSGPAGDRVVDGADAAEETVLPPLSPLSRDEDWEDEDLRGQDETGSIPETAIDRAATASEPPIRDDGSELVPVDEPAEPAPASSSRRAAARDASPRPAAVPAPRRVEAEAPSVARSPSSGRPPAGVPSSGVLSEDLPDLPRETDPAMASRSPVSGDPWTMARRGDFAGAARSWSRALEVRAGPATVTLQLSANCDTGNLEPLFRDPGAEGDLFLLPVTIGGGDCYRVCYGVYPDRASAERDAGSIPGTVLRPGVVARPVPLANLLSR